MYSTIFQYMPLTPQLRSMPLSNKPRVQTYFNIKSWFCLCFSSFFSSTIFALSPMTPAPTLIICSNWSFSQLNLWFLMPPSLPLEVPKVQQYPKVRIVMSSIIPEVPIPSSHRRLPPSVSCQDLAGLSALCHHPPLQFIYNGFSSLYLCCICLLLILWDVELKRKRICI